MREHDPVAAWLRSSRSQRRVGPGAVCVSCGKESRPYGLIFGRDPPCCYRCDRIAQGQPPYENNHVFGQHNSDLTIRYLINDHRAVLSVKQLDWTDETLKNSNGDCCSKGSRASMGWRTTTAQMLADCIAFCAASSSTSKACWSPSTGRTGSPLWRRLQRARRAVPLRRERMDEANARLGSKRLKRLDAGGAPVDDDGVTGGNDARSSLGFCILVRLLLRGTVVK